jgi:hypothetical protein
LVIITGKNAAHMPSSCLSFLRSNKKTLLHQPVD